MLIKDPPHRIVSLVPSMTESLFDLGFGSHVAGITNYCIYPKGDVEKLPRVGGTKDPRIDDIRALKPDLVIGNQEENSRETIHKLRDLEIPVWLTFPKSVGDAVNDLWHLARFFRSEEANARLRILEQTIEYARLAAVDQEPIRYFCPIWFDSDQYHNPWWMTFNQETYSSDLLRLMGAQNVFAERKSRYPVEADLGLEPPETAGERDDRYPRVRWADIISSHPELILVPDEPYPFTETSAGQIATDYQASTGANLPVFLVEGSLITWPGTRIARAIAELAPEFTKLTNSPGSATL